MNFTKKTRFLLSFLLSVTVASSTFISLPAMAEEKVKATNYSQNVSDVLLTYAQGTLQNTKYGKVQGYQENEGKTLIWKGIPYAKAPVGELRWKAPVA